MTSLWTTLLPIIIGSALVPVQVLITVLLLRSEKGRRTAVGYVGGLTTVRLLQGLLFGILLSSGSSMSSDDHTTRTSVILLIMGLLFLVSGVRSIRKDPDPDDPPPKWLTMTQTVGPVGAFGFGVLTLAIAPKFWVFTLGAIAAIQASPVGQPVSTLVFLLFVVLAEGLHVAVLVVAFAVPAKSAEVLAVVGQWLEDNNRIIMIVVSLVFGTWFVAKALQGFGVI
ncbi:MAG TPA: GAP family protein [Ornithinimicrobium sp.]|uniref:GAP family protein n=1 Tax=Ornithinimicrobium sp. TaxID=1977084 RepID=UPI002B48E8FA|nr:GAP family protein [Ornithinimicrobium sp.]HKJ11517.1 GAP family protein [Ornithinimicrobium sp.]